MRTLHHIGVPIRVVQPEENYVDGLKVYLTDISKSPNRIEFLRFVEGSPLPEVIQTTTHIAYEVPDLDEALKGQKVLVEPFRGGEGLMCAFIEEEGIALELMCFDKQ
jgi:hypothetical protein